MNIKEEFWFSIIGSSFMEAYTLDMFLYSLKDGLPRKKTLLYTPINGISGFELERKVDKLLQDGFIKSSGHTFIITSDGQLHLSKGGYSEEVKQSKRTIFSFWLSILAFIISIIAIVVSFF